MNEKNFLNFVAFLTDIDCPWHKSVVTILPTSIEVRFITTSMVHPSDLGWLNTHAVGGKWFITSENDETHIVVRFYDEED